MKTAVLVSVIIATFNRSNSLVETIESLLAQEYDDSFDYEIIIVDNNSKDATKDIVQGYINQHGSKIKYYFEPRQGKSNALNTGIKYSNAEILAFTDDDCVVRKDWLLNIVNIFRNKDIDLLGGKVTPVLREGVPGWLDINKLKGPIANYYLEDIYVENNERKILPTGSNLSFRRSSCDKFGYFESKWRAEDTEFCMRWDQLKARIAYSSDVCVFHNIPSSRLTKKYFRKWYFLCGKNISLVYKNKFSQGRRFLAAPFWVYRELFSFLFKFLKGVIMRDEDNFFNEVYFLYNLGLIFGLNGFNTNFENLR